MSEAEEVFPPVNPDESLNFNESRLSLGLGRLSMGSVGGYNTPLDGMRLVSRLVVLRADVVIIFSMLSLQAKYRRCEGLRGSGRGAAAQGLRDVTEAQRGRKPAGPEDSSGWARLLGLRRSSVQDEERLRASLLQTRSTTQRGSEAPSLLSGGGQDDLQ